MISAAIDTILAGPRPFQWYRLLRHSRLTISSHCAVFPSTYRSDTVTKSTEIKVEEQVNLPSSHGGREGHEHRYTSSQNPPSRRFEEEIRVTEKDRYRSPGRREENVHIYEEERTSRPTRQTKISVEQDRSLHIRRISISPPLFHFPAPRFGTSGRVGRFRH
ncbi:hypothetical protein E4T49_03799 [Aureobasidium sp. EXF-10728]|nr:hypothetical protein E4T49_03799 [Aureobasidium sp. EXF-10728]